MSSPGLDPGERGFKSHHSDVNKCQCSSIRQSSSLVMSTSAYNESYRMNRVNSGKAKSFRIC